MNLSLPSVKQTSSDRQAIVGETFQQSPTVEIILDSSRFGSVDTEIIIAYSPCMNQAAYLAPQVIRDLCWRKESAGEQVSAEDRSRFKTHGFKTRPGMKTYDFIRLVNHISLNFLGRSLQDFQLPSAELQPLQPNWVRVWSTSESKWFRIPTDPEARDLPLPELPSHILQLYKVNELSKLSALPITSDQVSYQMSGLHFLLSAAPQGMGLFTDMREDPYHRSWNDFLSACCYLLSLVINIYIYIYNIR